MSTRFILIVAAVIFAASGVLAETPPADNAIKSVRQDLTRLEPEAKGLTPARKANIKRLQRLVKITRQRLDSSSNKGHPSWVETDARLSQLEKNLETLLAGGSPAPAPAAAPAPAPAAAPAPSPAQAAKPAAPAASPAAPTVPSTNAAAQPRPAKPAAPARPATKPAGTAAALSSLERTKLARISREASNLARSLNGMRRQQLVALQAPTQQTALRTRVKALASKLGEIGKPENPEVKKQAAEIAKLEGMAEARIAMAGAALTPQERQRVETTAKRVDAAWKQIKGLSALTLQHKGAPEKYGNGIMVYDKEVKALPKQSHPEVKKIAASVADMQGMYDKKLAVAKALSAKYGYVSGRVHEIKMRYAPKNLPPNLAKPLTVASTKAWADAFMILQEELAKDVTYLETIQKDGLMDLGSILFWVRDNSRRLLSDRLNQAAQWIDSDVGVAITRAKFIEETDAKNKSHVANRLLGEGQFEKSMMQLRDGLDSVAVATVFDTTIKRKSGPDRAKQKARIEAAISRFHELAKLALTEIRMPKARSTDAKLLAVAAEIFKDPEHKAGQAKRMVINFGPERMEKKEGWIDRGTTSTAVSIYHYVWDEFQVTTAEKVGDKWFMHYNTFRYYHKGDRHKPSKRWYLSGRIRGSEILEANIDK